MGIPASKKIRSWTETRSMIEKWQADGLKVVFTNGCFDILHMGHISYLEKAAELGQKLVIGVNSDSSTKNLKGDHRPINVEYSRMYLLASLSFVDCVVKFDEETPFNLISTILPNILVKGGDYLADDIIGADIVRAHGGEVKTLDFVDGYSTTDIESRILSLHRFKSSFDESE
jgi:rfaE bifunctional protein nucleotidyltransferase chain/domain